MRGTKWAWAHLRPRPPRSPGGPRCAAPSGPDPSPTPTARSGPWLVGNQQDVAPRSPRWWRPCRSWRGTSW